MSSLAAARADNFYYPPGWTPEQGSLNTYHGQHALRERARKLDQGILIIRFEMPFHVWCGGCGNMVAKGVRFNAEKKQIGNYYSTKIWSFKMKSACCQHEIEIHTDPKNCDYIVVSGAEKKVVEYDAEDAGTAAFPTAEEREKLADPFFRVEHFGEDAKKAKTLKPGLGAIKAAADSKHADPWHLNRKLRAELRAQKTRVAEEEKESRSKGLGIRLLPEAQEDRLAAAVTQFQPRFEENQQDRRAAIRAASIFSSSSEGAIKDGGGKASRKASQSLVESSICCSGARSSQELGGQSRKRGHAGAAQTGAKQQQSKVNSQSDMQRRAALAAKRRRIDTQGVLHAVLGKRF